MRPIVCLFIALICGRAHADPLPAANARNSVPRTLWIEYSEREGVDFRLQHATADRDPTNRVITAYALNWRFSVEGWREIEIAPERWIRFRTALKEAGCERLRRQSFDEAKVKAFWTIHIVYPDVTISAAEADSPTLQRDFDPIRKAIRELTDGVIK